MGRYNSSGFKFMNICMLDKENFNKVFTQNDPVEGLREIAINLKKEGLTIQDIYNEFYRIYKLYLDENKDYESDVIADVMDMITGYYVGRNLFRSLIHTS